MNPKNNNQNSQILRENFDTHIEAMLHFQDEVQDVHTYDKKKQCILNNDYHN